MAGPRNPHGVNDTADCYRTIGGVRWCGDPYPGPERVAEYRKAGVRCRKFDDDLFIHPDDVALVNEVDDRLR